jgi:hypothetical protein
VDCTGAFCPKAWLKNAIGMPFYINTAPTPNPDASVSSVKGKEKSGNASKGATHILSLRVLKALVCVGVQRKESFFNKSCKGLQIKP